MKTWLIAATLGAAGMAALQLSGNLPSSGMRRWEPPAPRSQPALAVGADQPRYTGFGRLPVQFVENQGQVASPARFVVGWPHAPAWITASGLVLTVARGVPASPFPGSTPPTEEARVQDAEQVVQGARISLTFEGAFADARVESLAPTQTRYSYFLGKDSTRWIKGASGSRRLCWSGLYPGITVELYGDNGLLEYDIGAEQASDVSQVIIRVEGAERLAIEPDGSLRIDTAGGSIRQGKPPTWEVDIGGKQRPLACSYRLIDEERYGFALADHDSGRAVVIDPELQFGTFLGGHGGADECYGVAVDQSGFAYLVGSTSSVDFPVTLGAFDTTIGAFKPDGFVAMLSPAGDSLLWATYLGGNSDLDAPRQIALSSSGDLVVAGNTGSTDFPTTPGAWDSTLGGSADGYVTRLLADGMSLAYSTFIGGSVDDTIRGMALDSQDRPCFAGKTSSPDFPVSPDAYISSMGPVPTGMLVRLSADGSAIHYSTFVPGASGTQCFALDASDHAFLGGTPSSLFVASPGAYQTTPQGFGDGFVMRFDMESSSVDYATYLGGSLNDAVRTIDVDVAGAAHVSGETGSPNFPTTRGAFDRSFGGELDVFVSKLSVDGSALDYSTFVGGTMADQAYALNVASDGQAYVVGQTLSANFPTTADAIDSQLSGGSEGVLVRLSADGGELGFATFFGGTTLWEFPLCTALDSLEDVFVAGYTHALDFPTTPGSFMPAYGPGDNNQGFILKFAFGPWTNLGQALAGVSSGVPTLVGDGTLEPGTSGSITLANAMPIAPAFLIVGLSELDAQFKGGTMVPSPLLILPMTTSASGEKLLSWPAWPAGLPSGAGLLMQYWIVDVGGPSGFAASNGLRAVIP